MMSHGDNEKPCIRQNTDSMRQVKCIVSGAAERRSTVSSRGGGIGMSQVNGVCLWANI